MMDPSDRDSVVCRPRQSFANAIIHHPFLSLWSPLAHVPVSLLKMWSVAFVCVTLYRMIWPLLVLGLGAFVPILSCRYGFLR